MTCITQQIPFWIRWKECYRWDVNTIFTWDTLWYLQLRKELGTNSGKTKKVNQISKNMLCYRNRKLHLRLVVWNLKRLNKALEFKKIVLGKTYLLLRIHEKWNKPLVNSEQKSERTTIQKLLKILDVKTMNNKDLYG